MGLFSSVAGALTGGILGGIQSSKNTKRSQEMSREQMNFQERMSNTAYQRATKDMEKAGLNPALAYSQGPASAPSGAMGQVDSSGVGAISQSANSAASKIFQNKLLNSTVDLKKEQVNTAAATAKQIKSNTEKIKAETNLIKKTEPQKSLGSELIKKGSSVLKQIQEMQGNSARVKKMRDAHIERLKLKGIPEDTILKNLIP